MATRPLNPTEILFYDEGVENGLAASNGTTATMEGVLKAELGVWRSIQNSAFWGYRSMIIWHEDIVNLARRMGVGHVPATPGSFGPEEEAYYDQQIVDAISKATISTTLKQQIIASLQRITAASRDEAANIGYGERDIRGIHECIVNLARDMGVAAKVVGVVQEPSFITVWKTDNAGGISGNSQIMLPLEVGGAYNFTVDWGDGTQNTITAWDAAEKLHTFPAPGVYNVVIKGLCRGFGFDQGGDKDKLVDVLEWSEVELLAANSFRGCTNLIGNVLAEGTSPKAVPASCAAMFNGCTSLERGIGGWNMAGVTDISYMLQGCLAFNGPLNNWDVRQVTDAHYCLEDCQSFNQDIGAWRLDNCELMYFSFRRCYAWQGGENMSGWTLPKVWHFRGCFNACIEFNGDLSNLNFGAVTRCDDMLNTVPKFDRNLGGWDISLCGNFANFMAGSKLSTPNYDATLAGWAPQTVQSPLTCHMGDSQYCDQASHDVLTGKGWTLTDGGLDPNC